jgi:hypothetical protein
VARPRLAGPCFADYAAVDGEFVTAPLLHAVGDLHLRVVARLKGNLPELFQAAQQRFRTQPPTHHFREAIRPQPARQLTGVFCHRIEKARKLG